MKISSKVYSSRIFVVTTVIGVALVAVVVAFFCLRSSGPAFTIRMGYFHGGRTALMLRAYEDGVFDKDGQTVDFYSKNLRGEDFMLVPKSIEKFNEPGTGLVGKIKGTELIDGIIADEIDCGMVGESSFVQKIHMGAPIVAIAELGHDVKEHSGHVFMMRHGIAVNKPEDYRGKVLVSRRAGPGDAIFLFEFLEKQGVNLETDMLVLKDPPASLEEKLRLPQDKVIVVPDVYEDVLGKGERNHVIDGGYYHLMSLEAQKEIDRPFYVIQPLQAWANPELSHALIVCNTDFVRDNRAPLITMLKEYILRIKYEHSLSYEERTKKAAKGMQMAVNIMGLNYPQYDLVPTVGIDLLEDVERLLRKYDYVDDKQVSISDFVDNSLVQDACQDLGIREEDDFWQSEY